MSVRNLQTSTQVELYEECGRSLEGLRGRFAEWFSAIADRYRNRAAVKALSKLSARQLEDIGFADHEIQVRTFGRRLDLGSIDRDLSRYTLLGDESRRL